MAAGIRGGWRGAVYVALATVVATGCSTAADGSPKAGTSAKSTDRASGATGTATAAKSGGTLGPAGSACELPVSFDTAEDWKPQSIDAAAQAPIKADGTRDVTDPLFRQGPVTLVCEIDAKPAGNIGYLRVWTGKPGAADAATVLKAFVAAEHGAGKAVYRAFDAGGLSGTEVEYVYTSEALQESKKESAFAVTTDRGPVVVHLGGLDTGEHTEMFPAYRLAQRTLRTT
ncbi:lipoprotein [Streptomyces sp. NPDC086182]|uniref:lipoprotein n=1 Tax=Streptomyces sp. NPDC086182 TaxID=3155058 RepID=UPI003413D6F8